MIGRGAEGRALGGERRNWVGVISDRGLFPSRRTVTRGTIRSSISPPWCIQFCIEIVFPAFSLAQVRDEVVIAGYC